VSPERRWNQEGNLYKIFIPLKLLQALAKARFFSVALQTMDRHAMQTLSPNKQYLYSLLSVLTVAGVSFTLSDIIGYKVVALILLFTVSVLAISFDILPVLLSATLSAFVWGFFFIPPRFTIHIGTTEDTILLIMYFVIAMINGVLTFKIRKVEKVARLREERANSVKLYNAILDSLSHELRTPLAAIIGATDNLQFNENLTAAHRQDLVQEISKASLRLNQQVENLLNISRLESGHIQPKADWCDIVELVYEVVKSVEENHPARKINISVNQHMPLCLVDKGILHQVVYNLLNNAAIHTPPGSPIEIMATCHADVLEFVIEDGGKGFDDKRVKEVFSRLSRQQGTTANGGSGLGLSIVKGFTEALKGDIELSRGALGGAKFTLAFPVKTAYFKLESE
jgi:two-component system, OmpR family, sensor histidine kinase KdpD